MSLEHNQRGLQILAETEPEKLESLSFQEVQGYYHELPKLVGWMPDTRLIQRCQSRIELLRQELVLRRGEERSERQHREACDIGKKTLRGTEKTVFWARFAVVVGVVVPVGLYLISELYSSKTQRAKNEAASHTTSQQIPTPIAAAAEPEASSSISTPSPQQTATAQPSP